MVSKCLVFAIYTVIEFMSQDITLYFLAITLRVK